MNMSFAHRLQSISTSPTLAIAAYAKTLEASGKKMINLSIGEPDFDTPQHIKTAAIQAIRDGHTKYTAIDGIPALKTAISQKLNTENELSYARNQIIVSCGAKHSLYNSLMAIINPGDEVIIPAPYWVSYPDMVKLAEGTVVILPTHCHQHFKINPEQLRSAITPHTKAFIFNSPANPTGMAYSVPELQALAQELIKHPHVAIISDDIYEHHLWRYQPFQNLLNVCPDLYDQFILINSLSKTYAMTGWRIGYAAGPANVIDAMKKIQSHSTSNPNSIAQYAALAALSGPQDCVKTMATTYQTRHDHFISTLSTIPGIECMPSDGTFYTFPRVKQLFNAKFGINNDLDLANYLLSEANLVVVPGSAFGAPEHIRLSYALPQAELDYALQALQQIAVTLLDH